ncbi:T-cell ecto-ADP-ribosyltransferase 1 [Scomber japonicus]|uniref:T-cell ecto-ADP-ribosyltransferase 1 n=1 Tax=Scomber japonicus TaxID=13676 RepID=UPI00230521C1|nr:T-cell ecto-ADP-ribosyltransferase 1 [Scomber japonicus]XP_053190054.1 T-cell ecto-ADP-ribosyltransferase 1 [Scomber japonicus]
MWCRRKTLLSVVIFTALCYKVTAVKMLTIAPEAVDDLYKGCNTKALEMVQSGLLRQELNSSEGLQSEWGKKKCSKQIPGGVQEHTDALLVFQNGGKHIEDFNNAVETMGGNVSTYENYFQFKSLHFLLTDSMRLQNPEECKEMGFISDDKYEAKIDSKVRFGRFILADTDTSLLTEPDEGTLFRFTTCFFVNLEGFCNVDEDHAVISPSEEFTVVDTKEHDEYNEIILKHSRMASSHNCYMFSRSPADVSTKWLVLVLVVFSLYFFNC